VSTKRWDDEPHHLLEELRAVALRARLEHPSAGQQRSRGDGGENGGTSRTTHGRALGLEGQAVT
jgi:hypothetical protein